MRIDPKYNSGLDYPLAQSVACTVIITSFNEEETIGNAILSVLWAKEILLIDSYSTDRTLKIAAGYPTVRIVQRIYKHAADQKNYAIPLASHDWVFILDSDEIVPAALAMEVKAEILKSDAKDAYWIKRKNRFMGQPVNYSGWQGDKVVRLFKRDIARYENKAVHAEIDVINLRIGYLKNALQHDTFKSIDHFLAKTRRYARLSAKDHDSRTGNIHLYHWLVKPAFRFFSHYILRLGFLDGYRGIIISGIMAWGVFLRYVYLKELRTDKRSAH